MSIIRLNIKKTVAFLSLTVLLLLFAAIRYTSRSSNFIDGNMPLDNLQLRHSNAKTTLVRPDKAAKMAVSLAEQPSASSLRNFTVVTAYFNIGTFIKANLNNQRNSSTYLNWMWPYRFIQNGVVAYFDDAPMAAAFMELRRGLPTKVIMVDRSNMWAFSLLEQTRAVFSKPDYPKNHPKSTNAEYVLAMHAKYELIARAVREDYSFGSAYIAWMDLGIYRELPRDAASSFMLHVNPCLHDTAVMYTRIYPMSKTHTMEAVMRDGIDWVSGNFFIARRDVLAQFCDDYMQSVESYLNRGFANHDQSVLLAMYLNDSAPRPSVPLQAIMPSGSYDPWFYMAHQARHDALEAHSGSHHVTNCSYEIYT